MKPLAERNKRTFEQEQKLKLKKMINELIRTTDCNISHRKVEISMRKEYLKAGTCAETLTV